MERSEGLTLGKQKEAGGEWADDMMLRAHRGEVREFRSTNAVKGVHSLRLLRDVGVQVRDAANDGSWVAYTELAGCTDASAFEVFKLWVRLCGVVVIRFERRRLRYLLRVFRLLLEGTDRGTQEELDEEVARFLDVCPKVLGPAIAELRRILRSSLEGNGQRARAMLYVLALLVMMNIGAVEAGHAHHRRTAGISGGMGRVAPLPLISAQRDFGRAIKEMEWLLPASARGGEEEDGDEDEEEEGVTRDHTCGTRI